MEEQREARLSHRDRSEERLEYVYCRIAIGQYFVSDELCLMGSFYAKFRFTHAQSFTYISFLHQSLENRSSTC